MSVDVQSAIQDMNLIQKLAKIRKIADAVKKDKQGYNYSYADIINILAKITAGMEKYRVTLIPSINPGTAKVTPVTLKQTKVDKQGKIYEDTKTEMLVEADMTFTWINNDDTDDKINVPWFLTGLQSDPSQSFGSGDTYCTRYFLTSYFQIAQTDSDVDAYRKKQKEAELEEQKAVLKEIKNSIDDLVRSYLEENKDMADKVREFMLQFTNNGDYRTVKEPILAAKILNDFKEKFINNKEGE